MNVEVSEGKRNRKVKRVMVLTWATGVLLLAGIASVARTTDLSQQGGRDEVRIELGTDGFTPSEFQHAPGTFAIAVENKTLSGEYTLRLKAEDGTVLNEFQVQKGSSAWSVSLSTGGYLLTEANHPQWTCRIVVQ